MVASVRVRSYPSVYIGSNNDVVVMIEILSSSYGYRSVILHYTVKSGSRTTGCILFRTMRVTSATPLRAGLGNSSSLWVNSLSLSPTGESGMHLR